MQYMMLLYVEDRPDPQDPGGPEYYGAIRAFAGELGRRGALIAGAPLLDPDLARTVRTRNGRPLVTDGPFAETTEWLGGYFIVGCRDREEAVELARLCPVARAGTVELRPVAGVGAETET